jgi:hypothetical protein
MAFPIPLLAPVITAYDIWYDIKKGQPKADLFNYLKTNPDPLNTQP